MSPSVFDLALSLSAAPVAVASAYLTVLTVLSRRPGPGAYPPPHLRFDLVVPAHDEEDGIAETVASLNAIDYPRSLRRIIVVADNCTDATADRARAAGALVLERNDSQRRGKGYALEYAFAHLIAERVADAVVVVDADTIVSANLLDAFAARLEGGALAVQCRYGVRNPDASWRTTLMAVAFALFNDLRSLGRDRLHCSVGLRGNGMCFSLGLLRHVPHDAFSVVEDLEYGIRLGLAGHRVHYAGEAAVLGEMVANARSAGSQRHRWEQGRRAIVQQHAIPLLKKGVVRADRVLIDLAVDLCVPSLAKIVVVAVAGSVLAAWTSWHLGRGMVGPWVWGLSLAGLAVYVFRGWLLSGTGARGLVALAHAPVYVVWKMALSLRRRDRSTTAWVRTDRERRSG